MCFTFRINIHFLLFAFNCLFSLRVHSFRTCPTHFPAGQICCFNRHYAERSGTFTNTGFPAEFAGATPEAPMTFFDPVTLKPLFRAPVGRTAEAFLAESAAHGWPSFRDAEVAWEHVRVLPDGETVSVDGTHLGHNLPDRAGNRYCINLCSVAGVGEQEGDQVAK
jgi:peptide methionine sulfoxide reductase MsrB